MPFKLGRRHFTLLVACLTTFSAGTNYAFSAYAPQLAAVLDLTSTQTNLIGASGNLGVYIGGPFVGRTVDKKGPRPTLIFASAMLLLGYLGIYTTYKGGQTGIFATLGVPGLMIVQLMTGLGSTGGMASCGNGVAKAFGPRRRGLVMSMVLATFGLSAFVYGTVARSRFIADSDDPTATFLLLLAFGTSVSMLIASVFIRLPPRIIESIESSPSDPLIPAEEAEEAEESTPKADVPVLVNVSGKALLKELDFYLLFLFYGLTTGIGLMYINNVGTVIHTLALPETPPRETAKTQAAIVSLLSVFNCLGRLSTGLLGDYFLHHSPSGWRWSRVFWFIPVASFYFISQVLASTTVRVGGFWGGVALPTAVTGFGHGSLFGVSGVLVVERFGIRSMSANNGTLALAPAIFGQFMNLLFGRIYDHNVHRIRAAFPQATLGPDTFRLAFHITTGMSLMALAVAVILSRRQSMRSTIRLL